MKEIDRIGAQGDCLFRRVPALPAGVVEEPRRGAIVVAHSETGHNHEVDDLITRAYSVPGDPMVCYLQVGGADAGGGIDVVHRRPWDTHETVRLLGAPGDVWEVRRQREWTPEGWRRVED